MSKLDNIVLDCINKALDGKEEKLGDYVDPTKEQLKALFYELTDPHYEAAYNRSDSDPVYVAMVELRQKIKEL